MSERTAWGYGLTTWVSSGEAAGRVLDAWFPEPALGPLPRAAAAPHELSSLTGSQEYAADRGVRLDVAVCEIDLDQPPRSTEDAYLRLHLLSYRMVRPNEINLDGIFGVLPNVVWTSVGACPVEEFERTRVALREGFVNYNAGTLGASMVEGRISSGVVVGDGSDVGGGASIMGTLSGGGKERIVVGRRCLIGANAGIGISLGDDCLVEAGAYITAGSKLTLSDGRIVKAATLSGESGWQFWRNSITGALEARPRSGSGVTLNDELHANA